jgi:hypothetical protein
MQPDGSYRRRTPVDGAKPFGAQDWLLSHPSTAAVGVPPRGA